MGIIKDWFETVLFCFAFLGIALIFVSVIIVSVNQVGNIADITYEGQVIATAQSSLGWEHTTIYMKTYAEDAITFSVEGYHTLQIESTYRICTKGSFWKCFRTVLEVELIE